MAEKLALIDKDLLIRLLSRNIPPAPPPNPVLKQMDRIDEQLQSTLEQDTPERIKSQKINELLLKHDTFHKQYDNQFGMVQSVPPATAPLTDPWRIKTVVTAPLRNKKITEGLLDHIKSSNRMQWDDDGRVVVDGTTIPGTNILDLVHSVTRKRTKAPIPEGSDKFLKILNEINTPRELVPNLDFLKTKPFGITVPSIARHTRYKGQPNPVKKFIKKNSSDPGPGPEGGASLRGTSRGAARSPLLTPTIKRRSSRWQVINM